MARRVSPVASNISPASSSHPSRPSEAKGGSGSPSRSARHNLFPCGSTCYRPQMSHNARAWQHGNLSQTVPLPTPSRQTQFHLRIPGGHARGPRGEKSPKCPVEMSGTHVTPISGPCLTCCGRRSLRALRFGEPWGHSLELMRELGAGTVRGLLASHVRTVTVIRRGSFFRSSGAVDAVLWQIIRPSPDQSFRSPFAFDPI